MTIEPGATTPEPALVLREVRKTYANGFEALKGVSFTVQPGDFLALLGPNGAGKTTLIGILTSLVRKTAGTVAIFGIDIDQDFPRARSLVGVVPQEFNCNFFETVSNVVLHQAGYYGVPRREARRRLQPILERLNLWDKRNEVSRTLSGGMKRRLMIARALIHRPRLLILDEPTAGVDLELRYAMWDHLREINQAGVTIILTTHYLEEAELLCNKLAIINEGRLVESGDVKSLLRRLKVQTYLLDLAEPVAAGVVAEARELGGYALKAIDPNTVEAELVEGQTLPRLLAALARHGFEVVSLKNKTNRLEELFLRLVRAPREDGARSRA